MVGAVSGALVVFFSFPRDTARSGVAAAPARTTAPQARNLPSDKPLSDSPSGVPEAEVGASMQVEQSTGPAIASLPATPVGTGDVAIPVVGIQRATLRDHFDDARGGRVHRAIDISAPRGTPVIASIDGEVLKLFLSRAGGITLYQVDDSGTLIYYYAHLDSYADGIAEKKRLRRGDVLGYVGTTGNAPPGAPHLHFAIERIANPKEWWRGDPINPYPILTTRGVTYSAPAVQ